ncbi:MAG: uracil-DNA glycosylase [Mariprofundales bacterium]|nr:uracil-DNA glycosylase [Mariprofundales bacterium]
MQQDVVQDVREEGVPTVAVAKIAIPTASSDLTTAPVWDELVQQVVHCTACDLAQGRSQTVFASGNPHADLLLIGEAPGPDEERQGEPLVGRPGNLLTRMLAAIGLVREQVLIINVVKCRPSNNRDPRPQEIASCRHFMDAQIALAQPKVIGLLGRLAACAVLAQDAPLSVLRHQWHQVGGIPTYVTHHPSFLLRSPQQKAQSWQDLLQIKARLDAVGGLDATGAASFCPAS